MLNIEPDVSLDKNMLLLEKQLESARDDLLQLDGTLFNEPGQTYVDGKKMIASDYLALSAWLGNAYNIGQIYPISFRKMTLAVDAAKQVFKDNFPQLAFMFEGDIHKLADVYDNKIFIDDALISRLIEYSGSSALIDANNKYSIWRLGLDCVVNTATRLLLETNAIDLDRKNKRILNKWLRNITRFPMRNEMVVYVKLLIEKLFIVSNVNTRCIATDLRDSVVFSGLFNLRTVYKIKAAYAGYRVMHPDGRLLLDCSHDQEGIPTTGDIAVAASKFLLQDARFGKAYLVQHDFSDQNGRSTDVYFAIRSETQIIILSVDFASYAVEAKKQRQYAVKSIVNLLKIAGFDYQENQQLLYINHNGRRNIKLIDNTATLSVH